MAKRAVPKGVVKDIVIVGIAVLVIWFGLQLTLGSNPFFVVVSGSMIPAIEINDVLIVQGHEPFEDIEIGDIIVFNRPSDHDRVIVHRVVSILDDDPKTLRTKGDNNSGSIPGTDFPITEEEYIGKVAYTIPQIGYFTKILQPPVNYILIAIVIGVMVVKQMTKKKKEKEHPFSDPSDSENQDTVEKPTDMDKIEKDSEYSKHLEKSDIIDDDENKPLDETKTDKTTSDENEKK